jgi:hypothetical protein
MQPPGIDQIGSLQDLPRRDEEGILPASLRAVARK